MTKRLLDIKILNKTIIILNGTLLFTQKNIDLLIETIRKYFVKNQSLDIKTFKELSFLLIQIYCTLHPFPHVFVVWGSHYVAINNTRFVYKFCS